MGGDAAEPRQWRGEERAIGVGNVAFAPAFVDDRAAEGVARRCRKAGEDLDPGIAAADAAVNVFGAIDTVLGRRRAVAIVVEAAPLGRCIKEGGLAGEGAEVAVITVIGGGRKRARGARGLFPHFGFTAVGRGADTAAKPIAVFVPERF